MPKITIDITDAQFSFLKRRKKAIGATTTGSVRTALELLKESDRRSKPSTLQAVERLTA